MTAFIILGFTDLVEEKTYGVVKECNNKVLYVQNMSDTSQYVIVTSHKNFWPSEIRAFTHVAPGNTLKYVNYRTPTVPFGAVKRINSKKMADFAKEREKKQNSATNQKAR